MLLQAASGRRHLEHAMRLAVLEDECLDAAMRRNGSEGAHFLRLAPRLPSVVVVKGGDAMVGSSDM